MRDQVDESGNPIIDWEFFTSLRALAARQTHLVPLPEPSSSGAVLLWGDSGAVSAILYGLPGISANRVHGRERFMLQNVVPSPACDA
jgi:hypothetical protein